MKVLTAGQVRLAEEAGFACGVSYASMMETAGIHAADILFEDIGGAELGIAVVCGKGKNGGDGFVCARWFKEHTSCEVKAILAAGEPEEALCVSMLSRLRDAGVPVLDYTCEPEEVLNCLHSSDLVVDAIFGIGFAGEARGFARDMIEVINASCAKVCSLDIPSGLACDTNEMTNCHIKADMTITMLAPKPALVLKPTREVCGELRVADIGIPAHCIDGVGVAFCVADETELRQDFQPRAYDAHKGNFGHVLSVCGSYRMPGAAVLAADAAVSLGAGLVTAAFASPAYPAVTAHLVEAIFLPLEANAEGRIAAGAADKLLEEAQKANVVLVGCGLGVDADTTEIVRSLVRNVGVPLILDADGINILASDIDLLKEAKGPVILTPHPGEMARLCGMGIAEVNARRLEIAKDFARNHGVTLILKGANSVIADGDGACYVNPTGGPALARGGSGDVLAGMVAAFVAQGLTPLRACVAGAYVHGYAADIWGNTSHGLRTSQLAQRAAHCLTALLSNDACAIGLVGEGY